MSRKVLAINLIMAAIAAFVSCGVISLESQSCMRMFETQGLELPVPTKFFMAWHNFGYLIPGACLIGGSIALLRLREPQSCISMITTFLLSFALIWFMAAQLSFSLPFQEMSKDIDSGVATEKVR